MKYSSLRDFIAELERQGKLIRVSEPVSKELEITEIHNRLLAKEDSPAVIFENVEGSSLPLLTNLFGTIDRVAMGMGRTTEQLREVGETLAFLRQPEPPKSLKEAWDMLPLLKKALKMKPKNVKKAPCQEVVLTGDDIDLSILPIQTCWPDDVAPLITWPLVVTKSKDIYNLGIYRMQVLSKNKTIMRWLKHRGGAQHHAEAQKENIDKRFPVAVVIGADPATILAAVTPIPDTLSEYDFAGLLGGQKLRLVDCKTIPLKVPATAEIVLEGYVSLDEYADEGPFGDHTGYYNSVEQFPVFNITAMTMRKDPIYLSTFTGRPPDEPSILGEALNEVFIPLLQQQFPEIIDFWLPPEGCSYRVAVISMKKSYAGHAKRIMMGAWSFLRQFTYTKLVIIVDDTVNARDWNEVMLAITHNVELEADLMKIENTPIDYLDFASPISGLGGKLGIDATTKIDGELSGRDINISHMLNEDELAELKIIYSAIIEIKMPNTGHLVVTINKTSHTHLQKLSASIINKAQNPCTLSFINNDINPSDWKDIIWAMSTRMDFVRDVKWVDGCIIFDATDKLPTETNREWGKKIKMDNATIQKLSAKWDKYGLNSH